MKMRLFLIAALLFCTPGCGKAATDEPLSASDAAEHTAAPEAAVLFALPDETPAPAADDGLLAHTSAVPGVTDEEKRAVMHALSRAYDGSYETFLSGRPPVGFYARAPFSSGSLVVAMEPGDGEIAPELFYVEGGSVHVHTVGADCWSINMARLDGYTILFGMNFADGRGDTIEAEFIGGTRVSAPLLPPAPGGQEPGFLLIAEGAPDLSHLTIYEAGQPVADERCGLFAYEPARDPFGGGPLSTLSRVHFCTLYSGEPLFAADEVRIIGSGMDMYDWEFVRFVPTCGCWRVSDAWRNNRGLYSTVSVPSGTTLPIENLPGGIDDAYFVYTLLDDGSDDYAPFTEKTSLDGGAVTLPDVSEKTFVTLVIVTPGAVYALPFVLE